MRASPQEVAALYASFRPPPSDSGLPPPSDSGLPRQKTLRAHYSLSSTEDAPAVKKEKGASAVKATGAKQVEHLDWSTYPPHFVRTRAEGTTSAPLLPGEDGFAIVEFDDEVVETDVPNLLLQPPVQKKPAARGRPPQKRPAAAEAEQPLVKKPAKGTEDEEEEEEEEEEDEVGTEEEEDEEEATGQKEEPEAKEEKEKPAVDRRPAAPIAAQSPAAPVAAESGEEPITKVFVSGPSATDNPRIEICAVTATTKRLFVFGTTQKGWGHPSFGQLRELAETKFVGLTKSQAKELCNAQKIGEDVD